LPLEIRQPGEECRLVGPAGAAARKVRIGKDLRKKELLDLLEASHWNKAEVARRLGVSRTAVWKYMKKWDIPLKNPVGKKYYG
jgi:transcriptional regulator of acetoin/glycerol metabolism